MSTNTEAPEATPEARCTFTTVVGATTYLCTNSAHPDRPAEHWLRSAREVAFGREHIVQLGNAERRQLIDWLMHPNGSLRLGRLVVEAVERGGICVRTRPFAPGGRRG